MSRRKNNPAPLLPPRVGERPTIAILGRPNVGKSTLFNRLVGRRAAIVEDRPGVTRDRLYADAELDDKLVTYIDMGGFEADPEGLVEEGISHQCRTGLEQADLVLFVVDGRVPPTNGDHETVEMLRKSGRPSILVINKIDGGQHESGAGDSFTLGLEPAVMVSALHGRGFSDLEDAIYERLPDAPTFGPDDETEEEGICKVAVIGRPNAGKSSLINKLLGEDRLLTLNMPGTTRDPVDSLIERDGKRYIFVDTAGIRRKRSVPGVGPEKLAVTAAVQSIEKSDVVVLLVDAEQGVAEQDAKVLGLAIDRNRAVVVGLNKWDLVQKDPEKKKHLIERMESILTFSPWASHIKISALTGKGIDALLNLVDNAYHEYNKRVSTSEVNRLFEDIIMHHPPPMRKGKSIKLYYASQVAVRPPTFVVHCNYPADVHFSYRRYVQNRLRETFGFAGTPVRVIFRMRKRR